MLRFGIDLGGTKIEGVIIDTSGKVIFRERIATEQEKGYQQILSNLSKLYRLMCEQADHRVHSLGIGTPGAISAKTGFLKNSNTLCLNGALTRSELEDLFNHPLRVENDANCFALAEASMGAGKNKETVFGVIMGTGCGGGLVFNQKLHSGPQAIAGEWGHMSIDPAGLQCYCGNRGCVETLISGGGLENLFSEKNGYHEPLYKIVELFHSGDKKAEVLMSEFFKNFGRSMANLINIIDPDIIVLGGGVSNIDEIYTEGLREVERYVFNDELTTPIVKHQLGDSAGVLGAALIGATHEVF